MRLNLLNKNVRAAVPKFVFPLGVITQRVSYWIPR